MRYGNPSTASVIERLQAAGCERILFFPLYPQYSATTTATANDEAFRALMRLRWQPAIRTVPAYHDHPRYIEALAQSVEEAYAGLAERPDVLLTSYHGMPERYLAEGDPYFCHCHKTTRLLRDRLGPGFGEVVVAFQSRFGKEEWLKPYTVEEVARLARAGKRRIAVMAPVFAADCVETLEEIREEIRLAFLAAGGEDLHLHPLPERRAGARGDDGRDRRARARRLALRPAQPSSLRRATVREPALGRRLLGERRDRTPAVDLPAVADDRLAVREVLHQLALRRDTGGDLNRLVHFGFLPFCRHSAACRSFFMKTLTQTAASVTENSPSAGCGQSQSRRIAMSGRSAGGIG